eukprot:gene41165-65016_t
MADGDAAVLRSALRAAVCVDGMDTDTTAAVAGLVAADGAAAAARAACDAAYDTIDVGADAWGDH